MSKYCTTLWILLVAACGCNSARQQQSPPREANAQEVEAAFYLALTDLKAAKAIAIGPSGSTWGQFELPVSADPIIKAGPAAIPVIERLRDRSNADNSTLADACLCILRGRDVVRGAVHRSQYGGPELVWYSVTGTDTGP